MQTKYEQGLKTFFLNAMGEARAQRSGDMREGGEKKGPFSIKWCILGVCSGEKKVSETMDSAGEKEVQNASARQ